MKQPNPKQVKKIGMTFKEVKTELMKNPEFKKEYEKFDLMWEFKKIWIKIRIKLKI